MKRSFLFILLALICIGILIFAFRDQIVSETSSSNNLKTTEVLIYSNCPIEETILRELITVYQDSSCPKIQIIRMDLPTGQNTGTITIPISFMNKFRASLFPLPVDFLMEDVAPIKTKAFESNIYQLITQKQGATDCSHDSIKTKTIPDSVFRTIKVLDSVNKFIKIQKKNKVIFKVIACGTAIAKGGNIPQPQPPQNTTTSGNTTKIDGSKEPPSDQQSFTFDYQEYKLIGTNFSGNEKFTMKLKFKKGKKNYSSKEIVFALTNGQKEIIKKEISNIWNEVAGSNVTITITEQKTKQNPKPNPKPYIVKITDFECSKVKQI